MKVRLIPSSIFTLLFCMFAAHVQAAPVQYAGPRSVRIAENTVENMTNLAKELTGYLDRIDTEAWSVDASSDMAAGVWLLNVADADALPAGVKVAANVQALGGRAAEAYIIHASPSAIYVIGNSKLAVQHGMFDLLERLGCRFLTPAADWTVIPEDTGLTVAEGPTLVEPDFLFRRIWYANGLGVGHSPDGSLRRINETYKQFHRSTRQGGAFAVHTGHSYYGTFLRHREKFENNPEWARMNKEGEREPLNDLGGRQSRRNWCRTNEQLAELVLADRIELLRKEKESNPNARMVSMDPNDGSSPCLCEPCKALGNASDQVVYLANYVARGIREVYPDAIVGFLIYPPHNMPPEKQQLEANIIPCIALAFNRSGLTYGELIEGWANMGAQQFGVYDYLGVYEWDYGMPDQSEVSYNYVRQAFPHFSKQWDVQQFSAQSQASWGRYGPSMYLARKLLWDIEADAEAIYQEYFDTAFGSAAEPMRQLFDLWDTEAGGKLSEYNIARWLTMLDDAIKAGASESTAVQKRLEDMAAYLHTVVLYRQAKIIRAQTTDDDADQEKLKQHVGHLMNFVWRTRERQVMQFWGFMTRMGAAFGKQTHTLVWQYWGPGEIKKGTAHWMTTHDDYTSDEIMSLFREDLETYREHLDVPVFSMDLVPLFPREEPQPQAWKGTLSGPSTWYIYVERQPVVRIAVQAAEGSDYFTRLVVTDAKGKEVFSHSGEFLGKPDRAFNQVTLRLKRGLYRVQMSAPGQYKPDFKPAIRAVWEQSRDRSPYMEYFTPGYFFVPRGVDHLEFNAGTLLTLKAPSWEEANKYKGGRKSVPVGQDAGEVWHVQHVTKTKTFELFNVPPYLANSPANLLVPREMLRRR